MWTADSTVITADSTLATADGSAEAPAGIFVGGPAGASRGRMIRRRKRDELDLAPPPLAPSPPDLKPPVPGPPPPPLLPPQPGLSDHIPAVAAAKLDTRLARAKRAAEAAEADDEDAAVALLLELIS